MAEPSFQPSPNSARGINAADSFNKGIEEHQSMMGRASQNRQQLQMEEMRQQQIDKQKAMMPVIHAAATADLLSAKAAIDTNTRQQLFRAQAAAKAPELQNRFLDALSLADWNSQSAELSRVQAEASFMGQFPEYKGFLDAVDKARANAVTRALTDEKLEQAQELARMAVEGRVQVAEVGAQSRAAVAETGAESRVDAAKISAGSRSASGGEAGRDAAMARLEVRSLYQQALEQDKEAAKLEIDGKDEEARRARLDAERLRSEAKKKAAGPDAGTTFTTPGITPGAAAAPATAPAAKKLYLPPEREGTGITLAPGVKEPKDILSAYDQAVADGVITIEEARDTLTKLGFKKKGG